MELIRLKKIVQGISGDSLLEVLASYERLPYPDLTERPRMSWLEIRLWRRRSASPMRSRVRKVQGQAEQNQGSCNYESIEAISAVLRH
jgi:hypothetical protein